MNISAVLGPTPYGRTLDSTDAPAYIPGMGKNMPAAVFILAMVVVIVAVDVLFFRHNFWERLGSNIGIVLVFAAFYFRFLK
jgi:hypothetical protein